LLDEIEKAHADVFNILLQVLDDGRLTDNKGRVVNFKNTLIIMTSNIGSAVLQQNLQDLNDVNRELVLEKTKNEVFDIVKRTFRPEFLNRIDELIMFAPLSAIEIREIVRLQINHVIRQLEGIDIKLRITDPAIDLIAEQGFDPQYGARPIKRLIQKIILNELSRQILEGKIKKDQEVLIDRNKAGITIAAIT
jgi:ATP-dependent Clp protease ATP-binding subunit ClpB